MLQVTCKSADGRTEYKVEGDTHVELVEKIVDLQSLFEMNNICGLCKSPQVFWSIRDVDGSRYFEKKCSSCGAALPYHQNKPKVKPGALYTSWKDKWQKYVKPVDGNNKKSVK